jgi:hypothetical protein
VTEAIDAEIKTTVARIARRGSEAEEELSKQLGRAKDRVSEAEKRLDEQREVITDLVTLTIGQFPYRYLKSIHDKQTGPRQK